MSLPWGYKRAFLCCALLFLLGTVLQCLTGGIPPHLLQYPLSAVLALVYTYALVVVYMLSGRFPRLRRLYDSYSGTASIVSVVAMALLFGLIPQGEGGTGPAVALGWTQMRSNYLVLCAAFFGNGDKFEAVVTVAPGQAVAVGEDEDGKPVELPFMLRLEEFTIEEYPVAPGPVDTVKMGEGQAVTMPPRYPKSYRSDVTILSPKGERQTAITVNHPARVGPWHIYQYSFGMSPGGMGRTSTLLCVKDGWYPLIGAGLWMLLGAGALMFLTAGGRRKKEELKP